MTPAAFESIVEQEFARLPRHIVAKLQNVGFVLEQEPSDEQLAQSDDAHAAGWYAEHKEYDDLLGLYEGLPLNERGATYGELAWGTGSIPLPDKITLFQGPLERHAEGDEAVLRTEIYETLLHEIGHHFGFCEEDVRRLEDKRAGE